MKSALIVSVLFMATTAFAAINETPVKILGAKFSEDKSLISLIKRVIPTNEYREVKVQIIKNDKEKVDHYLAFLSSKKFHRVSVTRVEVNGSTVENYKLSKEEFSAQPGSIEQAVCPDTKVEFIAFAPNDDDLEQQVTIDTANAAEKAHLKVVRLLKDDATRENYLNYMVCPNLKGNFYDGDANPDEFTTADGVISSDEVSTILKEKFRNKVTNIWLACEAYNNPMLSSANDVAQSQVYAAGINDLEVGPSDRAAACAMQAAVAGKPMKNAFNQCLKQLDNSTDEWGYAQRGADTFGK
jgi:hypothetical protein